MKPDNKKASETPTVAPAISKNPIIKENQSDHILSQKAKILTWLSGGNSLTSLRALNLFGCWSLAQRIAELRREGVQITTETVKTPSGKRIARYLILSEKKY